MEAAEKEQAIGKKTSCPAAGKGMPMAPWQVCTWYLRCPLTFCSIRMAGSLPECDGGSAGGVVDGLLN